MKTALVTGITGQDGAYLTKLLLNKGYKVVGAVRHTSCPSFWRTKELGVHDHPNFNVVDMDLTDMSSIMRVLNQFEIDEVYNLGAQSFVAQSFVQPITTAEINAMGPLNMLEAIRIVNKSIKFYQASTSEMFGKVQEVPQRETTPFYPRSPYGVAKLFSHWATINYRESYGMFACSGILFNHESPLRGEEFVTRKITKAVANIAKGKQTHVELGNINAKRDWGFAGDYVEGMWRMMQHKDADTYVLATGKTETVRNFLDLSFKAADIEIEFHGEGIKEVATNKKTGQVVFKVNPEFYRPAEVDLLIGDPSKAADVLGWSATTTLEELCTSMVQFDLR